MFDFCNFFDHQVMDDNEEFARDFEHCEEMLPKFRYKCRKRQGSRLTLIQQDHLEDLRKYSRLGKQALMTKM